MTTSGKPGGARRQVELLCSLLSLALGIGARRCHPVTRVTAMVDRNEDKRQQGPIGIKITRRAFGRDWRLPIVNTFRE